VVLSLAFLAFGERTAISDFFQTLINFVYLFGMEMANNGAGQTIGKRIMGIKTVDAATLGPITPRQALIHCVGKLLVVVDVIIGVITKEKSEPDKQDLRIMQRVAGTSVIKIPKAA